MFKVVHRMAPPYISELFTLASEPLRPSRQGFIFGTLFAFCLLLSVVVTILRLSIYLLSFQMLFIAIYILP